MSHRIVIELPNRDRLEMEYTEQGEITALKASGCLSLLKKVNTIKAELPVSARKLFVFNENDHASLIIREALLKALGKWQYPYQSDELCHCRAIPTATVDAAIVAGFQSVEEVANETSAGTACGTCRTDTQQCIEYRLKDPLKALRE